MSNNAENLTTEQTIEKRQKEINDQFKREMKTGLTFLGVAASLLILGFWALVALAGVFVLIAVVFG